MIVRAVRPSVVETQARGAMILGGGVAEDRSP